MTREEQAATLLRAPREEIDAIKAWARIHGRSLADELRLAVRLLLAQHMLAHLKHPAGREDVIAQGLDPEEEIRLVKERLAALTREAFTRPAPAHLMASRKDRTTK